MTVRNYAKCATLPLGAVHAKGFLREQLLRNRDGMGGHLPELEPGMIADPYIRKTVVRRWAGGDREGWGAEISGNYYAGLIQLAYTLDDEDLKKKAGEWIDAMLKNRQPDGYLGTYIGPDAKIYEDYNAWGTACGMRALIFYYEATGREDVFDAVYQCMLWFARNWSGDRKTIYAGQVIVEPVLYCYQKTGDERLLKFAEDYCEFQCNQSIYDNSYRSYLEEDIHYYGNHTAAYGSCIKMPAMMYAATGKKKYLDAAENEVRKLQEKCIQLSGGPVSVFEYLGPVSSIGETEYCSFAFFNQAYIMLSAITGRGKYGDYAEQIVYNGAQGARRKDEKAIAYLSAPNQLYATVDSAFAPAEAPMQVYAPCYPVSCCPVTSVSSVPEFVRGMAMQNGRGDLYLAEYGPAQISYDGWEITVDTLYPFRNEIRLQVSGSNGRKLYCRVPVWAEGCEVTVNGRKTPVSPDEDGYFCVENDGEICIAFAASVRVVKVNDKDASSKFPMAFRYGALLFSLKIDARWEAFYPETETPLPPEWPWYNVKPVLPELEGHDHFETIGLKRMMFPWSVAVDENLPAEQVEVELCQTDGYPWEDAFIRLSVPAYKAAYSNPPYPMRSIEPLGDKQAVQESIRLTLVPYGATNLRITYFPRADV